MEDLAWLLLVEVIANRRLARCEHPQCRGSEPGEIWKSLEAREQAVPAEQSHEPRQPSGREGRALDQVRMQPQCAEVAEARVIGPSQRGTLGLQLRSPRNPLLVLRGLR